MNRTEIQLLDRGGQVRRQAINSPLKQGTNEDLLHFVDLEPWGASDSLVPSVPVILVLDQDDVDVTATVAPDAATIVNDTEVQWRVKSTVVGDRYRVYVKATIDTRIGECWYYLDGEK